MTPQGAQCSNRPTHSSQPQHTKGVLASTRHKRTEPSREPLTINPASGDRATRVTDVLWPTRTSGSNGAAPLDPPAPALAARAAPLEGPPPSPLAPVALSPPVPEPDPARPADGRPLPLSKSRSSGCASSTAPSPRGADEAASGTGPSEEAGRASTLFSKFHTRMSESENAPTT